MGSEHFSTRRFLARLLLYGDLSRTAAGAAGCGGGHPGLGEEEFNQETVWI